MDESKKRGVSYHNGAGAETHVASLLRSVDLQHEYVDTWHDYLVNNQHRLEVKSSILSKKQSSRGKPARCIASFCFREDKNRQLLIENKAWVFFVLNSQTFPDEHLSVGIVRADRLGIEKRKWISIHDIMKLKPLNIKEWKQLIA